MKNQMRQGTVRYPAKTVDMERKPSLSENSLSKLVVYPIAEYYDGGEIMIYVNPKMKDGFYLPEEINKHDS